MKSNVLDRRPILLGVLLCTICLAYFYSLETYLLSGGGVTPIFALLLAVYDANTAWVALFVCVLASLWRWPAPILKSVDWIAARPVTVALASTAALALGSIFVYHDFPLAMDEYAPVLQSKIFAAGHIVGHFPPQLINWLVVPGFNGMFLFASPVTGKVIEAYWPGFALLLAPFQFVGAPWLCNPALAGIAVYLTFRITLEITQDRRTAAFAVLFAIASGAFVADAISFYSMQAHLTANLLYAWLLMAPSRRRALAAGLVGSLALILHNPVPHALFALPWLAAFTFDRARRRHLLPLLLGYLPLSIIGGVGWFWLRMRIGADLHHGAVPSMGLAAIFRWPDATMLNIRLASVVKMWLWAVPCLYLFAWIGWRRLACDWRVRLLAWSAISTFVGYLFVTFDQGHGWGYRYFHSAFGVIPILAGCATMERPEAKRFITFAGAVALLSLITVVPFQLHEIDGFISRHLAMLPAPKRPGNDVFFIRWNGGFYIGDMIQNDPQLRRPDLRMLSYGSQRDAALVRRLWPHAVEVNWGPFGEEWNLGPMDQRRRTQNDPHLHFVFPAAPVTRSR